MEDQLARLRAHDAQPPLGVVLRTPLWDSSGYAEEGRTFAKALARGNRRLCLEEIHWNDHQCVLPDAERTLLRALTQARRHAATMTITDCIPTLVEPDPCSRLNVLRTFFETDRIPADWHAAIDRFDEVWVSSEHTLEAFRRSGTAPERLRIVPSCVDTDLFRPDGDTYPLPDGLRGRFVLLAIFDWQLRKGWDVLLRAYCRTFDSQAGAGLFLKVTRTHGHPLDVVISQAAAAVRAVGQELADRPDIVISDAALHARQLAALYRSVDAFVLPSRGEGWGRPYMEAMASGLPVIATRGSGNLAFMNDQNSLLVPAELVPVPDAAAREIPPYAGHQWFEPDEAALCRHLRTVVDDRAASAALGRRAREDVRDNFSLEAGRDALEQAITAAEARLVVHRPLEVTEDQIRVCWEGELFAGHSFANINEKLALELIMDERLAVSINRVQLNPTYDRRAPHAHQLLGYVNRPLPGGPEITVRHAYPPNWTPPEQGRWVHIQPWEFGHLPLAWLEPLIEQVDQLWAPSHYVRRVYERSGVPPEKIHVIPWGVDPAVYHPQATPLLLPTAKTFRFLFVGGLIPRKGFDTLLDAYLEEFSRDEDVCLVVKDLGSQTFYRHGNERSRLVSAAADPASAEISYLEGNFTEGQLASLYTACDCLVMPYRGEGFGLPILEAMACGRPPIVPAGGASDDFVDADVGYLLPAQEVEGQFDTPLAGPPLVLSIRVEDVRRAMRTAFEDRQRTRQLGHAAAARVAHSHTWATTARLMQERLQELAMRDRQHQVQHNLAANGASVTACMVVRNVERVLADCLARIAPFVDELVVADRGSRDRSGTIAKEYGALVIEGTAKSSLSHLRRTCLERASGTWVLWLDQRDRVAESDALKIHTVLAAQPADVAECSMAAGTSTLFDGKGKRTSRLSFFRR